jgi:hypothetical protein
MDKERQLAALCSQERNILKVKPAILGGRPFYWIDLNAGCGYNKQFHVPGSPLVFLDVMFDIPYRAWFIDRDPEATEELKVRLRSYHGIEICTKDNRDALLDIASCLPYNPVGGILADPNTWAYRNGKNGNGIPVEELRQFCSRFRRMDLLMNLNTRVFSMMDGHNRNGHVSRYPDLLPLEDFPSFFNRQYWLISYSHNGHTGFVRLAGRNMPTGDYAKWGWYHWDSPQGRQIRENVRVRKRERDSGQLGLFAGALP